MDRRLVPTVIPNASSGSCTLVFLDRWIDMAASIIAPSLDLGEVFLSWSKGNLVDRLFSNILSSPPEGFSVSFTVHSLHRDDQFPKNIFRNHQLKRNGKLLLENMKNGRIFQIILVQWMANILK